MHHSMHTVFHVVRYTHEHARTAMTDTALSTTDTARSTTGNALSLLATTDTTLASGDGMTIPLSQTRKGSDSYCLCW